MTRAAYDTRPYTIPANGSLDLDITGTAIKHLRGNGDLDISFNNKPKTDFARGIGYPSETIESYTKVTLINNNAFIATGFIFFGTGNIEDSSITISAALEVKNEPAQKLDVDDADTQTALADILAMLQNETDQRSQLTNLANVTETRVNNATTTLVTSGANTNGIRVIKAAITGSSDFTGYIRAGSIDIIDYSDGGTTGVYVMQAENYLVPAGVALTANSSNVKVNTSTIYEVL